MTMTWREYQQEIANFFRSLGLNATVEASVEGARGVHAVDVWVVFKKYGFETKWLVECKLWTSAVPKEKVLALHQIAQDVGADHAFLLSESGFQSGAIQVAKHTNITLINLDDLRNNAAQELLDISLASAARRLASLNTKVRNFMIDDKGQVFPIPNLDIDEIISVAGTAFMLQLDFKKALSRHYSVNITEVKETKTLGQDTAAFIRNVNDLMNKMDESMHSIELSANAVVQVCLERREKLIGVVESLVQNGKLALFCEEPDGSDEFERLRLICLEDMKAVDHAANELNTIATGEFRTALFDLRSFLIDSVYLYLTKPRIPIDVWQQTQSVLSDKIDCLRQTTPTIPNNIALHDLQATYAH